MCHQFSGYLHDQSDASNETVSKRTKFNDKKIDILVDI